MKNIYKFTKIFVESIKKLCYDVVNKKKKKDKGLSDGKNSNEVYIMSKGGLLNVEDFACYIKTRYNKKKGKNISPIKLQKSLYFCYAYWGGFVNKSIGAEEEINESPYLFNADFRAWSYGPVIPEIYRKEQDGELTREVNEEIFEGNSIVEETINSLLDDLFEISDFKLVNISHADKCWQNNFDAKASKHNKKIDYKEIVREYTLKY